MSKDYFPGADDGQPAAPAAPPKDGESESEKPKEKKDDDDAATNADGRACPE